MKLGVMSDTHGNILMMNEAAEVMVNKFHVDAIIHLGDDLKDTERLGIGEVKLYAVPGIYEGAWMDETIPHRMVVELEGIKFLLSHTPTCDGADREGDINPLEARESLGVDLLLHGHTHEYALSRLDGGLITICPGHLKDDFDRGNVASYAIIGISGKIVDARIIDLKGCTLLSKSYKLKK